MTQWKWKMFAMPSAKQRMTQRTPVLWIMVREWSRRASLFNHLPLSVYACIEPGQLIGLVPDSLSWHSLKFLDLNSSPIDIVLVYSCCDCLECYLVFTIDPRVLSVAIES